MTLEIIIFLFCSLQCFDKQFNNRFLLVGYYFAKLISCDRFDWQFESVIATKPVNFINSSKQCNESVQSIIFPFIRGKFNYAGFMKYFREEERFESCTDTAFFGKIVQMYGLRMNNFFFIFHGNWFIDNIKLQITIKFKNNPRI